LEYELAAFHISAALSLFISRLVYVLSAAMLLLLIFPVSPVVDRGTLPSHAAAHYNRVNELTLIIVFSA
jgi:hypothetical protein